MASFAGAVKRHTQPHSPASPFRRDQGIIIQTVEGIELDQYVYTLGDILGPQNITNVSKISNGRLRIYLKSKELVDQTTNQYKTIKVLDNDVQIRPLQIKAKRIIIGNASPEIPHTLIEDALKQIGLKPTSSIIFLRAGLKKQGYEHILSSRRSVYIIDDFEHLPETTTINYDGTEHRIFISDDSMYCTFCKKHGHKLEECKFKKINEETDNNTQSQTSQIKQQLQQNQQTFGQQEQNQQQPIELLTQQFEKENQQNQNLPEASQQLDDQHQQEQTQQEEDINLTSENTEKHQLNEDTISDQIDFMYQKTTQSTTQKRPLPSISSSNEDLMLTDNDEQKQDKNKTDVNERKKPESKSLEFIQQKKKPKKTRPKSPATQTIQDIFKAEEDLKNELENFPDKYCLTYASLKDFLENVQGATDPLSIAKDYTTDIQELITTLRTLYPLLETTKAKHKFTRITTKLKNQIYKNINQETTDALKTTNEPQGSAPPN